MLMSSDTDHDARYAVQRVDDETYWNGRGWTRLLKRAERFVSYTSALNSQRGYSEPTRIIKVNR
jgi:hypothetical protein